MTAESKFSLELKIVLVITSLVVIATSPTNAQGFQDFIARLNSLPSDQRQAVVDSFLATTSKYPIIEQDTIANFVYAGNANSVGVPGDANGWDPGPFSMTRVQGTTLWYFTRTFEADARLDYKFVVNGNNWILDPRNPLTVSGGFGPNSELRMPGYPPAPEVQYHPTIPHGSLLDTTWTSVNLGNSRTIRIYTPPGYAASADSYSVIYVHDGLDFITLASAHNVLDYLTSERKIEPVIGVFIPAVNRTAEYGGSSMPQFTRFMVEELVPYIDSRYRTKKNPASRAVLGASSGGNISLWLGYQHPEVFGNIGAYSSSIVDSLSRGFSSSPRKDLTLYLDIGTYDISELIPLVRGFVPTLESKGYRYEYREYHEGHSWGSWRAHLDKCLELFFGTATSMGDLQPGETVPHDLELHQNYPNPFNPTTVVRYQLAAAADVRLAVYDLLGQEVAVLVNERRAPGSYEVTFNARQPGGQATGLASGVYLYRMTIHDTESASPRDSRGGAGNFVQTRKMILVM